MITRSKSKNINININKNNNLLYDDEIKFNNSKENNLSYNSDVNFDAVIERLFENKSLYKVDIDFDDASKAWRKNKVSIGNGNFKYLCIKRGKNNNKCIKKCLPGEEYCCTHFNILQKK